MTIFPKAVQFFTACVGFQVITTYLKQYFLNLMISRVSARKYCKELLKMRVIYTKSPFFISCLEEENVAVTKCTVDLRSTCAECQGYSALLHVLKLTGKAALNGAALPAVQLEEGLAWVPNAGSQGHNLPQRDISESRFKCQGLLEEESSAAVSSSGSCQMLHSRCENCTANRKSRLRICSANS